MWQGLMAQTNAPITITQNKVQLTFTIDPAGQPIYTVDFNGKAFITPSRQGFVLATDSLFYKGFALINTEKKSVDETWKPVWGEVSTIRNSYQQLTVHLKQQTSGHLLDIVFRVFDDGVGFRYEFPYQPDLKYFTVTDEHTAFNLAGDATAWWIPGDYDSNEYPYTTSKLSQVNNSSLVQSATDIAVRTAPDPFAVQTPLMLKTEDQLYVNIHEAALRNYPAMQLHVDGNTHQLSARLVPDAVGNKAYLHAPCTTPWRTIIVSDKAADLLASKMILNLNDPPKTTDFSWIQPMKFVGIWWEMQTGKSTWNYADADNRGKDDGLVPNGRHGANTANVKKYIDFAAANGFKGVLVEGWNTGWEDWFGNWKEEVFDFVTPYPDFNVKEIEQYAAAKGVQMIMHNETSGSATNYERQLDTAFRFMRAYDYPAVKTGYVGRIIPRGEHHDGQWMVNHYERVAQKGLQYHIMIDAHEPPRPTGLQRTFPNWMASEAGRGNEYNAFSNGTAPDHETILPFTRLMGGPMDYTPGIFKLKGYAPHVPDRQMHSTLAKQLALYVTIYSPLQMVADLPENYEAHKDAFQFIRDVPVDWDDTRILAAEPGDYITIARKEKGKPNWYIGAITDELPRKAAIPLHFLDKGKKYRATIYADADNADWKQNPEVYHITTTVVDATTILNLQLAAGGGAAIAILPI
ncbi:glycoside hydrolase family 97 protein [Chitinophaga agrisoli]|uniref:Glycoside hydrolase family 97 protein n=2 Tax=Chitinophaga agrisoli TaxID=2607653 RepID=A0A5B2W1K8_9BACT|nr:glycoside hydrolase family 97 protein [Chitinophaga agrisoli]